MESLLSAALVILIFLLVLVVFIPAYLERLSRVNRSGRAKCTQELRAYERALRGHELALMPYLRLKSAAYREATAEAAGRLQALATALDATEDQIVRLRCPVVYDYLLPAQHFVISPADMGDIIADTRGLRRTGELLARARAAAAESEAAIGALAGLPERLAAGHRSYARRLADAESAIHRERSAGIEAVDDLVRGAAEARRLLAEWETSAKPPAAAQPAGQSPVPAGPSLPSLDAGAVALESAATALDELEGRIKSLDAEREALDRRLRQATAALDSVQAGTKAGPDAGSLSQRTGPLFRRAAALLNESAPDHRRRREFNAAAGDVADAERLLAFGRDLIASDQCVRMLEERDDGSSHAGEIAGLRDELAELMDRLERQPERSQTSEAALAGSAKQIRGRAEAMVRRQEEELDRLSRDADFTLQRLESTWEESQRYMRLAGDDPLARRHRQLLDDYRAAQHRPAALEHFRGEVAAFERVVQPWTARVQETRTRIGRLRQGLPATIDAALDLADSWSSLSRHVLFIQQRTADFETAQARFAAMHHRREAETLMGELAAIESDIEARFDRLNEQAGRLRFLEADVHQIIRLAGAEGMASPAAFPPDHPERIRWDKAIKLIDHHLQSAHAATSYEDASVALLRAADVANKMAL